MLDKDQEWIFELFVQNIKGKSLVFYGMGSLNESQVGLKVRLHFAAVFLLWVMS